LEWFSFLVKRREVEFWEDAMAKKIMVIRHGEKPDKRDSIRGVSPRGKTSKNELSPRGWQRCGALARFFNPLNGKFAHPSLAKPDTIFASAPSGHVKSKRSEHTVLAVAQSLGKRVNKRHSKGKENKLLQEVLRSGSNVLIAWEHNAIIDLANLILGDRKSSPQRWPGSRFDLVWVFDQQPGSKKWKFTQVPQILLPGDSRRIL